MAQVMRPLAYLMLIAILPLPLQVAARTCESLWQEYKEAPSNKAITQSYKGNVAASWSASSIQGAVDQALAMCRNMKNNWQGAGCRVIDINGEPTPIVEPIAEEMNSEGAEPEVISTGTGFFVDANSVVTNEHVVSQCDLLTIEQGGYTKGTVSLQASDPANDFAILHSPVGSKAVASLRTDEIKRGESIVVYGFPLSGILSAEAKITGGIINSSAGVGNDFRFLQVSAPIQPGNSGGPLIDKYGNVIGVITSSLNEKSTLAATGAIPQNINFAIKTSLLVNMLNSVGVQYSSGSSSIPMSTTEIAESADHYAVQVLCWSKKGTKGIEGAGQTTLNLLRVAAAILRAVELVNAGCNYSPVRDANAYARKLIGQDVLIQIKKTSTGRFYLDGLGETHIGGLPLVDLRRNAEKEIREKSK